MSVVVQSAPIFGRERLVANRTYYVRTDGSNSNTGLANTAGGAFLTVQKALDTLATVDFNGFTITVQIADGTYVGNIVIPATVGQAQASHLLIQGNTGTPTNVVLSGSSGFIATIKAGPSARCRVSSFRVNGNVSNAYGIQADPNGVIEHMALDFGANLFIQIYANGGFVDAVGNYTISGGGWTHYYAEAGGILRASSVTVTASGSPAFSNTFAGAYGSGYLRSQSATFSGTVTGARYKASVNAVIDTQGGGASYFPGDSAGSTATGGQYA